MKKKPAVKKLSKRDGHVNLTMLCLAGTLRGGHQNLVGLEITMTKTGRFVQIRDASFKKVSR